MELFTFCLILSLVMMLYVSINTLRLICSVKGKNVIAAFLGFFEAFIWFLAVRQALTTFNDSFWSIALIAVTYSGGLAIGIACGGWLSAKIISGTVTFQVITDKVADTDMLSQIRQMGFAVSLLNVRGYEEDKEKHMLFIQINKKNMKLLESLIKKFDPKAFIVVNETKYIQNGFIK